MHGAEQDVGGQIGLSSAEGVDTYRGRTVGVEHYHVIEAGLGDPFQEVIHQVTFGIDNYDSAALIHVL